MLPGVGPFLFGSALFSFNAWACVDRSICSLLCLASRLNARPSSTQWAALPRGFARKGPGGKGEAKGSEKYVKRVDLFKYLAKWALRSYPDSQGRPLMTQGADAASTFEPDKLRGVLDADFCELLRRPCMGVNLAAASLDGAMLFAPKLQALMDDLVAVLEKEALAEPVRYMNLCRDVEWGSQESLDASKRLLKQVRATLREH